MHKFGYCHGKWALKLLNVWCEIQISHQLSKVAKANGRRPNLRFSQMQKLCKAALAASRVWNPASAWGRSRSSRKALCSFSLTVSTICRTPATQRRSFLGQGSDTLPILSAFRILAVIPFPCPDKLFQLRDPGQQQVHYRPPAGIGQVCHVL